MQVILKATIDTLGEEGDVVKGNVAVLAKQKAAIEARKKEQRATDEALAAKITGATITIAQRTGDDGKLFGSVTAADIATKFAELGIEIDKKKILLDEPIKTLGTRTVSVKIGYQVKADAKVEVVPIAAEI